MNELPPPIKEFHDKFVSAVQWGIIMLAISVIAFVFTLSFANNSGDRVSGSILTAIFLGFAIGFGHRILTNWAAYHADLGSYPELEKSKSRLDDEA